MPFQFDKGHKEESDIDSLSLDDDDVVSEVGDDELNQMVQVFWIHENLYYVYSQMISDCIEWINQTRYLSNEIYLFHFLSL